MISQLGGVLLGLPPALVLAAAAVLPALEASTLLGLVVPGETAVLVAGIIAHGGHLPLWAVMVAAAAGAVAGDQVGFALGRRWGPALVDHLPQRLGQSAPLERATAFLRRRGGWAVLLGRWTAVLRALLPSLAGASGLPRRRFVAANVVGGLTWAVVVAAAGFGAGTTYQQLVATLGRAGQIAVAVAVVVGVAAVGFRRARQRRRDRMATTGGPPAPPSSPPPG